MNRNGLYLAVAVIGLGLMALFGAALQDDGTSANAAPPGAIRVSIASSSTKQEWLDTAVRAFNAASRSNRSFQVDGKPVFVEVLLEEIEPGKFEHYRSGTMVANTISGSIRPTVLSPAEDSWIEQLNEDWRRDHASDLVRQPPQPLTRTPLVVAMWQSRAMALGCWPEPTTACTWQRLRQLARAPEGWGAFGHPEWGKLKFGYGYVGESNSGTLTALLLCMIGAGKTAGLTVEDVGAFTGCGQSISDLESAKVHSGKKSSWLLGWMREGGPDYLDAVTTYEQDVISFNQENGARLREPLVAVYPQDGTVVATHPYAILDGANWVEPKQARAAELFREFLLSESQQANLRQFGLRPANPAAPAMPPIEPRLGAVPQANINAVTPPDTIVLDRLTEVWHQVKKHAVIALVFDKSGSMQGPKLTTAIAGARAFVDAMDPEDYLIWLPFDTRVYDSVEGPKSEVGETLAQTIGSTASGGGTALYDAIAEGQRRIELKRKTLGTSVRYGIVVLSDGQDTSSKSSSLAMLRSAFLPSEGDPTGIQMHTIGIGSDADRETLSSLAGIAHGKFWDAKNPDRVISSYREIAVHY
jgi:Ca-activated chloride channel family protein